MMEAISRGGRLVTGFALGDAADPYAKLGSDFNLLRADASRADVLAVGGDFAGAVAKYKSVGQRGADSFGPEIDGVGPPFNTQPLTHDAWTLNGQLATLDSDRAGAVAAKALVDRMLDDYARAIDASRRAYGVGEKTTVWPYILISAGTLVLVWMVSR